MGDYLTDDLLEKLVQLYISDKKRNNISQLSKKYNIPYPTLRRKIKTYLNENGLGDLIREEYLPIEGFEYLQVGDTFQFEELLTIWIVKGKKRLDGDIVWITAPTKNKAKRHWVGRVLEEDTNE